MGIANTVNDLTLALANIYLFICLLKLFQFGVNPSLYLHKET